MDSTIISLERALSVDFVIAYGTILFIALIFVMASFIILIARSSRRKQDIEILNTDDSRAVRKHKRVAAGLPADFFTRHGYSYDWVFVFAVRNEWDRLDDFQKQFSMKRIVSALRDAGLETSQFYSVQRDEVYCKIRCPPDRLTSQADLVDYKLMLDPEVAREGMEAGRKASQVYPPRPLRNGVDVWVWSGRQIIDQFGQSPYPVYDFLYGKFMTVPEVKAVKADHASISSRHPRLYRKYRLEADKLSDFGSVDRIKIMQTIFEGKNSDKGCGFNVNMLVKRGAILAAFPLHAPKEKVILEKKWLRLFTLSQPIWEVKEYLGEKVALYFAFLGHVHLWLILPSLLGLGVFGEMLYRGSSAVDSQLYLGFFMSLWSTFLLEFWKRKESTIVMEWGMSGFEEEEADRVEYLGEEIPSPVNGDPVVYFPEAKRYRALATSALWLAAGVVTSLGVFASIFTLSWWFNDDLKVKRDLYTSTLDLTVLLPSVMSALTIYALKHGTLGRVVASLLEAITVRENHRSDTQHEDALIAKTFAFDFVNSYSACLYTIFLKDSTAFSACGHEGCLGELHYLLGTIFLINTVLSNVFQVWKPLANGWKREAAERKGADPAKDLSHIEKQFLLATYDQRMGRFKHFKQLATLFGYAVFFSVALPVLPICCLACTYLQIRVEAWALTQKSRRVIPSGTEDIGLWQDVFTALAKAAVAVNMAIVFLVSDAFADYTWVYRIILFAVCEHGLIVLTLLLAFMVDDVPEAVSMQLARQEFVASKLIDDVEDLDDSPPVGALPAYGLEDDSETDGIDNIFDEDVDPAL